MLTSMFLSQLTQGVVIGSGHRGPEKTSQMLQCRATAMPATSSASDGTRAPRSEEGRTAPLPPCRAPWNESSAGAHRGRSPLPERTPCDGPGEREPDAKPSIRSRHRVDRGRPAGLRCGRRTRRSPAPNRARTGKRTGMTSLLPCQAAHVSGGAGAERDVDCGAGGTSVDVIGKTRERIEVVLVDRRHTGCPDRQPSSSGFHFRGGHPSPGSPPADPVTGARLPPQRRC